ncbi:efflux RND transporter periplasmic adaptor subunit [Histidinibacterium lentulum]|nr:efflux RND transporter periplasmic adaptor subunit [Histidinibacterium lentulum]
MTARTFAPLAVACLPGALALAGVAQAQVPDPVTCLITPAETADLAFAVEGLVSAVHVSRGDVVAAGDVLAELDASVETVRLELAQARAADRHRIAAAEARRDHLEARADRATRLAANRTMPEAEAAEARMEATVAAEEVAAAEAERALAVIEAREAEARLRQKQLVAPMAGIVTDRALSVGERQQAQGPVLTLARIDALRVEAFPPISYVGSVTVGDTLTVLPEAPVDGAYPAVVTVVDQVFDAATGTFGIVLEIDNSDLSLPAGLRCELVFDPPS